MPLASELERAKDYGDIFALVKKAVKRSLGQHRVGLMLYLGNLPMRVGAFHPLGTNDIVLNRRLLEASAKTEPKWKAYVFSILLHEYLHTFGYVNERQVRGLTYRICLDNFGSGHPVVEAALTGPWVNLSPEEFESIGEEMDLERVKNFERIDSGYII
ncbi:MAG: hypothetical protein JSV27_00415 [Candidatus Bathyarchaeota archaeon]|nr:MAG: hypothetical protein JSV27_00415 [Candidatus Bathyarchaeota archaeon]